MIDLIYPLGKGSRWNNNEIRYSLRSVDRYLSNIRNVWIIGEVPSFLNTKIKNANTRNNFRDPAHNIVSKLLLAANNPEITDDFLYINDDHFFTQPFDALTFPNYYKGDLKDVRNLTDYQETVNNTLRVLYGSKLPTLDFDTHTPIIFNKQKFIQVMEALDWETPHGFCIKSMYANSLGLTPTYAPDGKFYKTKTDEQLNAWFEAHPVFSIDDGALTNLLKRKFPQMYREKSKFEK